MLGTAPDHAPPPTLPSLTPPGGTLIECQKLLSQHGASAVSAYVTHGVFPKESWRKFMPVEGSTDGAAFKCVRQSDRGVFGRWGAQNVCRVVRESTKAVQLTTSLPPILLVTYRYFWITDSCAQTCAAVEGSQPFEVLSLAEPIAAALLL